MAQHIVVTEYNPAWPDMFREEAAVIQAILGDHCVAIYHIGSTSVDGLAAKPVIDIMPVMRCLEAADAAASQFEAAGYEYLGEFGIPGRRYLRKGGDERTHQVHIFSERSEKEIERHLAVRDYLRTHPAVRDVYAKLKIQLAQTYPYDIEGYCDGKENFMQQMEREALEWKRTEREIRTAVERSGAGTRTGPAWSDRPQG